MEDLAALLDVAMILIDESEPDIEAMLDLLDSLNLDDLDAQTLGAVTHARMLAQAALTNSSAHATLARFALFRVARLIERRIPLTVAMS